MGQIIGCPLTGLSCGMPIRIEEKSFFLAEAEKPEDAKNWRREALTTVLEREYKYNIRSALDESGTNAFTCKICRLIQTCAYGVADITDENPNVLLELGVMMALGKPVIILRRKTQKQKLRLPSDIIDKEVIPFEDYVEIMPKLRKMVKNLPPPVSLPSPIKDLENIQPQLASELRKMGANIVQEFKESMEEAKLNTILSPREEKKEIPPELNEKIAKLEDTLKELTALGFPTDARTTFLRGNYFYNQEKYEEALANYNWSLELRPDDPATLNNRGSTFAELGKYDEALTDYNRSLKLRPDDPATLNNRGITYDELGKYDEAFTDYNRSLKLRPDHPGTLNNRGITYSKLQRYNETFADFNRSLELRPDDPATLNNRGSTFAELGKYDEALADFNRSLELKPDHPSTLYNLACLFSLWQKTDDALAYLEKAIDKDKKFREDAKTDKDFDNIRADPRFKKLLGTD